MRTLTRFGGRNAPRGLAKMMLALLFTLKGTALIYQGEELGLPQADIRRDQIRDPVGDLYYPYTFGRDGCRTPMPWNSSLPNLGFGSGAPWLPVSPLHQPLAANLQEADEHSTLATAKKFIEARKTNPVLRYGDIEFLDATAPVLAFTRTHNEERALCVFNMSGEEARFEVAKAKAVDLGCGDARQDGTTLRLGPYAAWFGVF
jgi:alpha-glucosidase